MRPVMHKTFSKDHGVQALPSQHPLHDVAVVAEQTSWLACVVAMIGAYLSARKVAFANSALAALALKLGGNVFGGEASPSASLHRDALAPSFWVIPNLGVSLRLVALILCAPLRLCLWGGVFGRSSGLDFRASRVFPALSPDALFVRRVVGIGLGKVSFPLFGGAFRLLLSWNRHSRVSPLMHV